MLCYPIILDEKDFYMSLDMSLLIDEFQVDTYYLFLVFTSKPPPRIFFEIIICAVTLRARNQGKQATSESKFRKWTSCILDIQEKTRKQRSR